MNGLYRLYLSTLLRVMLWKTALAVGLMVCLGLTEGIGLLMLVPLLQLVGLDVQQGAMGHLARFLASGFAALGLRPTLLSVLGVYVLIISLHGLLSCWQTAVNLSLEQDFVAVLRTRLYRAIANTRWVFFSRSRSADFTHVLTAEVERVGVATSHLLHSVGVALLTLVYAVLAWKLSPVATGLACASGAGLMLLLKGKTRVAQAAGEELSQAMTGLYAAVTEHLGGMKIAKSYGAEGRHAEVFEGLTERVRDSSARAVRNQAEAKCWFEISSVLLLSLLVYVSIEILAIPPAEMLFLLFLFARIVPRFSNLQQGHHLFANHLPAFASVLEMQARCEAAVELKPSGAERVELRHAVRLDRISFQYEDTPVIRDLSLIIPARKTTAIVGPSGSGKSTIADLIMGLVTPDAGCVRVDGTPLTGERVRSWRDRIGYVTQETFLFHDTIRANLLWAAPGVSDAEVRRALRLAAAEGFVGKLPRGLDTVVGDRGVLLSGGERQRVALARALVRRPSLLILDEATSSLDSENEERIQAAIERLQGEMTILIISHRLSAVRQADVIYVLEDGRVAESGRWGELIVHEHGRFRALCLAQGIGSEDSSQCDSLLVGRASLTASNPGSAGPIQS